MWPCVFERENEKKNGVVSRGFVMALLLKGTSLISVGDLAA